LRALGENVGKSRKKKRKGSTFCHKGGREKAPEKQVVEKAHAVGSTSLWGDRIKNRARVSRRGKIFTRESSWRKTELEETSVTGGRKAVKMKNIFTGGKIKTKALGKKKQSGGRAKPGAQRGTSRLLTRRPCKKDGRFRVA